MSKFLLNSQLLLLCCLTAFSCQKSSPEPMPVTGTWQVTSVSPVRAPIIQNRDRYSPTELKELTEILSAPEFQLAYLCISDKTLTFITGRGDSSSVAYTPTGRQGNTLQLRVTQGTRVDEGRFEQTAPSKARFIGAGITYELSRATTTPK